jgi:hypothetical protein
MQTPQSIYPDGERPKRSQSNRRRRDQRAENPGRMLLTERDKEIIKAVYEYRVLRQDQIQRLFFGRNPGARHRTQRRLVKLFDFHYCNRQFLPTRGGLMNSPALYTLDKMGAEVLRTHYGYEPKWYSSSRELTGYFLTHLMSVSEVRISFVLACRARGYTLDWIGETELKRSYDYVKIAGRKEPVAVIPDGYFVISGTPHGRAHFALELDNTTESSEVIRRKVASYTEYHTSGLYEKRYGTKSLRVLFVAPSQRRLANLKKAAEETGAGSRFWFAVLPELTEETVLLSPSWQIAKREGLYPLLE